MPDEVDYLLSILGKEGYATMDHWIPSDSLTTWESILDDEISPCVRDYELDDVKKRTDETIDPLLDLIHQLHSPCTNRLWE